MEIGVFLFLGDMIGGWNTFILIVFTAILGAWLFRHGIQLWMYLREVFRIWITPKNVLVLFLNGWNSLKSSYAIFKMLKLIPY